MMAVLYIVLPLAFIVAAAGIFAFIWAARRGEFDDLDTPPLRAIMDDDPAVPTSPSQPPASRHPR